MTSELKELLESLRQDQGWGREDVIIVLHTTKNELPRLQEALDKAKLKETGGIEIVPIKGLIK